jgi:RNA polymerase sigma-70 factor (ECF subfamily)
MRSAVLVSAAARGEDRVLDQLEDLYRTRYPDLLRTATAISGGAEAGRDAVNDAFASLVHGRRRYRGSGSVEAWAWRAVVNAAKKQHRASELASDDLVEAAEGEHSALDRDRVRTAIARLSERQRLILFLHYYADLDYAAIAAVCRIRSGTVGAALHTARERLRALLEESRT